MTDFEELLNDLNNRSIMVTTSKPYKDISHLRDDLLFVSDATALLDILKGLNDPNNSILIVLNNGMNIEIKLDESLAKDYPMVITINEKNYEVVEAYSGSELRELTDLIQNEEYLKEEQKESISAGNVAEYIQKHLITLNSNESYILEEIKSAKIDSNYSLSWVLYDVSSQSGKLDTGESVKIYQYEDGVEHDGGEIGVVIEIDDRIFIDYGSYSSWECHSFNNSFTEVERIEVPVIKIEYKPI